MLEASNNTGGTVSVNVSAAGRILETAGSTSDLKSHWYSGPRMSREIDAIASLREIDLQQTSVLEAKYARAGHT